LKILLDECVPKKLARDIVGHECATVASMGWRGVKNGELLRRITNERFDAMITVDKNLQFQQPIAQLPFALIVLDTPRTTLTSLRELIPSCLEILKDVKPGTVTTCTLAEIPRS
jgi:hypothetical protein